MTTRRRLALLAIMLVGLVIGGPMASAADLDVRIREVVLSEEGDVRLLVSVAGDLVSETVLSADAFQVTEQGVAVETLGAAPLVESVETPPLTVALLVDVSGSTSGAPLAATKDATRAFTAAATADGVRIVVVAFAAEAQVVLEATTDAQAVTASVDALEAGGGTALYDAIVLAGELLIDEAGYAEIVVFSDGADTTSSATRPSAIAAAEAIGAPVSVVALRSPDLDMAALEEIATATGGRVFDAESPEALLGAFQRIAIHISSQYVLTYTGTETGTELDIAVRVTIGGATAGDSAVVLNPRTPAERSLVEVPPPAAPIIPAITSGYGVWVGAAAAFGAAAILLVMLIVTPISSAGARTLRRGLRRSRGSSHAPEEQASLLATAGELVGHLPVSAEREHRLGLRLEQAGWPMRTGEFRAIQIFSASGALLLGASIFGDVVIGVALAIAGVIVPRLYLQRRVTRRAEAFEDQLADVLQVLAGTLRAGHGLLQAIDAVAQEAGEPARSEFLRVMSESRLGGSVEEALEAMADRVGSRDFHWVVIAMNVQREAGGNLAELLETVAATLRERAELRREVRTMAAEGRLSARILTVLPFLVAAYMLVVNPQYLAVMFESRGGIIVTVSALALMVVGFAWIRRVVRIAV